jgi:hypothetical protein
MARRLYKRLPVQPPTTVAGAPFFDAQRGGAATAAMVVACMDHIRRAGAEPTANVVEAHNWSLHHYFITAYADEAAMLAS